MGPDFFSLITGRKTLCYCYLQVGQLRGYLWSQSRVVAELDGVQGHKPRWSINQDPELGGTRDSHCFCTSMFFWAAFLPSLLDLLGLETFPLFPSDLSHFLCKLCFWESTSQPFLLQLVSGTSGKGTKYFRWIYSCICALAQYPPSRKAVKLSS